MTGVKPGLNQLIVRILVFVLPVFFTAYLVYGFIRPRISRQMRYEIEEEEEEGPAAPG